MRKILIISLMAIAFCSCKTGSPVCEYNKKHMSGYR